MWLREARFCRYKASIVNMLDLSSNRPDPTGSNAGSDTPESQLRLLHVSMFKDNVVADGPKALPKAACNGYRSMTPAGTSDCNGEITALFTLIQWDQKLQHTLELSK
jgi:hypothetical protein